MATRSGADVEAVLSALEAEASEAFRKDMAARYGIVTPKAFGVPMAAMQRIAKPLKPNHDLAARLWKTGVYEPRMVASMIDDAAEVTPEQMDRWRADFDNWAIVDTVCFKLFDQTPHAFAKIDEWVALEDEFGCRAAFALLASAALHRKDAEADLLKRLPLIEHAATDERNFVKKAVNWALRAIGSKGGEARKRAARDLAAKLAASTDRTTRWIGKDALKAFAKADGKTETKKR